MFHSLSFFLCRMQVISTPSWPFHIHPSLPVCSQYCSYMSFLEHKSDHSISLLKKPFKGFPVSLGKDKLLNLADAWSNPHPAPLTWFSHSSHTGCSPPYHAPIATGPLHILFAFTEYLLLYLFHQMGHTPASLKPHSLITYLEKPSLTANYIKSLSKDSYSPVHLSFVATVTVVNLHLDDYLMKKISPLQACNSMRAGTMWLNI